MLIAQENHRLANMLVVHHIFLPQHFVCKHQQLKNNHSQFSAKIKEVVCRSEHNTSSKPKINRKIILIGHR